MSNPAVGEKLRGLVWNVHHLVRYGERKCLNRSEFVALCSEEASLQLWYPGSLRIKLQL